MIPPKHLAIIMDGNGRWAQARGHKRTYGHVKGAQVARQTIREAGRLGIKYLTLYAFSTENWNRPASEVTILMKILEKYLKREQKTLMNDNVKFVCIGDISKLPSSVIRVINETVEITRKNSGLTLIFALNYGGRQEIAGVMKQVAEGVKDGQIKVSDINEELISSLLQTSFMPDPDLVIRTSGEQRISNFLIWQSAYTEFYFTKTAWPDFTVRDLRVAIESFSQRERRFGRILDTIESLASVAVPNSTL